MFAIFLGGRRKTDQNPPGRIVGKMRLGPLVRNGAFLVAIESLTGKKKQKTNQCPLKGKMQMGNFKTFGRGKKVYKSLTRHARVNLNSLPSKCFQNLCEGLRKRQ